MKTIDDLAVSGHRVLVRLDLNVPIDDGKIKACGQVAARCSV
jgi:3-phosphoglycerate kinase